MKKPSFVSTTRLAATLTGVVLAAGLLLVPATARASTAIAGDLDLALPHSSHMTTGWGFGFRVGNEFHVPLLAVTPEVGVSYYNMGGSFGGSIYQAKAGLNLGIGELLRPGVFGHLGIGNINPDVGNNATGFAWDAGVFLEFTLIPLLNLGVHGAYNHLSVGDRTESTTKWFTIGADATLVF